MTSPAKVDGRVLIDASNLRVGGGVQVAVSFLDELALMLEDPSLTCRLPWAAHVSVEVSRAVWKQLAVPTRVRLDPEIAERTWKHVLRSGNGDRDFDVSFVVFGPEYAPRRARCRIVGFADVTALYARPEGVPTPPTPLRMKRQVRGWVSRWLTRRADVVVVETTEMARRIDSVLGFDSASVHVVPNTVNGVFDAPARWHPLPMRVRRTKTEFLVTTVSRGYPHKNLEFLGRLMGELRQRGHEVTSVVTLRDDEWEMLAPEVRRFMRNVGELEVQELPALYAECDAAAFPSLLEAFSAMPLEAMKSRRPLFASDRPFVRAVCGDAPIYFDPLDLAAAADTFADAIDNKAELSRSVARGSEIQATLPSAEDRALSYLRIIDSSIVGRR